MSTLTTTSQPVTSSQLKRLIIGHPLLAYFIIAFAGSWIIWLPAVLAQNGLGLLPFTIPATPFVPLAYGLAALSSITGPLLAAFIVTAVIGGKAGVKQLLSRYIPWRVGRQGIVWYLLTLFGLLMLDVLVASLWMGTTPLNALIQRWTLIFSVYLPGVLTVFFATQVGEESGWSGIALPTLQRRYGALKGASMLGVLHALWHLPVLLVPGQIFLQKQAPVVIFIFMVLLILLAVPTRIVMAWIFNNTKGNIIMMILFHAVLDTTNNSIGQFVPRLNNLVTFGVMILCALLVIAFTKGRLSYKPERTSQTAVEPLASNV